jgi:hypothetical protein
MSNKELNSVEQDSTKNNSSLNQPGSRRKFFKKAAIGVTIASIPTRSVWATNNGGIISGHISGNMSGASDVCDRLAIWSHGKFKTPTNNGRIFTDFHSYTWLSVFGSSRPPYSGVANTTTLAAIINGNTTDSQLATMYINAKLHHPSATYGVYWPVVANGSFASEEAYAQYLYDLGSGVGGSIGTLITEHHAGGTGTTPTESCYDIAP